jgi:hypothetical protein
MKLLLLLCTAILPAAWAQVQWIPNTSPYATSAIAVNANGNGVCRGSHGGQVYPGRTNSNGGCEIAAAGNVAVTLSSFEVAVGLSNWSATPVPGVAPVAGATLGLTTLRPCRIDDLAGYVQDEEGVCRVGRQGVAQAFTGFQRV